MTKNPNRNRKKNINLAGLYAVPNSIAFKNGKPRPEVYGCVTKNTPYICRADIPGSNKAPRFVSDMTGDKVPKVLKNRMLAFWADKNNTGKSTCYLVEKSIYEEMMRSRKK